MEGAALVWWEAKTKDEIKKHGKITLTWAEFISAIKKKFYPLAHSQKAIMDWKNFRQLKGQNVRLHPRVYEKSTLIRGRLTNSRHFAEIYRWFAQLP